MSNELEIESAALVRWLRDVTGYSQEDIAVLCGMQPQSRTLVSAWENGIREPTRRQWQILLQIRPYLAYPVPGRSSPANFVRVRGET